MEKKVQLCIVGASGAGMSAAIVAAQNGVKDILILEKMPTVGGCFKMSGGTMAIDSPVQRRQGVFMNPDKAFEDLMKVLNWHCDAKLVRKWINNCGQNIAWLESLGMTYDVCATETSDPNQFRNTHHMVAVYEDGKWVRKSHGPYVTKCLHENALKYGAEILVNTRAEHLLTDDTGRVIGVQAKGPEGELIVHADVVLLATGSISSNKELIKRFYGSGEYGDVRIMAQVPHNTGDGLIMAEEVGATAGQIGTLFIGPHNHFTGASELTGMLVRRPHGIKLNMFGERFINEDLITEEEFGWMLSYNIDALPGKKCWCLMDANIINDVREGKEYMTKRLIGSLIDNVPEHFAGQFKTDGKGWRDSIDEHFAHEAEEGRAKVCETLEEVAEFIGCDVEDLKKTIETYNLSCYRKHDEEFLKDPKYLLPIEKAPYYVIIGYSGIDTCLGGLKIDSHQRVLKADGNYIPGLLAAGVMCSGWFNNAYCFFGSETSFTLYSGRAAGKKAAELLGTNYVPPKYTAE